MPAARAAASRRSVRLDPLGVAGHVRDADLVGRHVAALLHVDDDEHRIAHDQWLFRHLTSCDCDTWIGGGLQ